MGRIILIALTATLGMAVGLHNAAAQQKAALAKAIAALGAGDTWSSANSTGWRDQPETCSTHWLRLPMLAQASDRWGDPWCNTTSAHGKLMVTVLGGLAEFERHLILARTTEGRKRAQARGVKFGRKSKLTAHQRQEALARRAKGEALVEIARSYTVSHSTISRLA